MYIEKWNQRVLNKELVYKKNLQNVFKLPFLDNICLKLNNKQIVNNSQNILSCLGVLEILTNQKSKVCFAKKSIANLKIQKKMPLSCKVTLRRKRKNSFFYFILFFILTKLKLQIKKNGYSFNIGIKNLLLMPQLSIIHNFNLSDFGFSIGLNFKNDNFILLLSGFQIKEKDEKTAT